jgi:hypothetical protein
MNQRPEIPAEKRIEEPYSFSKDKVGRELGYPLKRSLLDSALHSASAYTLFTLCAIWDIETPMLFWMRVSVLSGEGILQFAAGA